MKRIGHLTLSSLQRVYITLECFNCTTLERMERRLRTVEETIRGGNGTYSYTGPHQRSFIRPGRPDMSHVTGSTTPRGYDKSCRL